MHRINIRIILFKDKKSKLVDSVTQMFVEFQILTEGLMIARDTLHSSLVLATFKVCQVFAQTAVSVWLLLSLPVLLLPLVTVVVSLAPLLLLLLVLLLGSGVSLKITGSDWLSDTMAASDWSLTGRWSRWAQRSVR